MPSKFIECIKCNEEFIPYHGKPGRINECVGCATDIPVYLAEEGSDDTGVAENIVKGKNIYGDKKAIQALLRKSLAEESSK